MIFKYKQVIVVRIDLRMSCGKIAAQAAHASLMASEVAKEKKPEWWDQWWEEGQKKVILRVDSEMELLELFKEAEELDLPVAMVVDKGLTEVPPNTRTAIGIGPAPEEIIDRVTGKLKLL